jgi:hypothetical protein
VREVALRNRKQHDLKLSSSHCVDCRPPGYRNPVLTSQEPYYVSNTDLKFSGGYYEEFRPLGYKDVCLL